MTEIFVARRSGTLREPDGTLHKLVAGKTLADGRHPGVTNSPESWRPMAIDMPYGDVGEQGGDSDVDARVDELRALLEESEADRDAYREQLVRVVDVLEARGALRGIDRERPGWLVDALSSALPAAPEPAEPVVVAAVADPETPEGRQAIREWAWRDGLDVSERGALPKAIVEQYLAAHA